MKPDRAESGAGGLNRKLEHYFLSVLLRIHDFKLVMNYTIA